MQQLPVQEIACTSEKIRADAVTFSGAKVTKVATHTESTPFASIFGSSA